MLIIGHRGAAGYEPENTLASFRKAMKFGVEMIELDVHLCKTGELVVIHDMRLERTTNGKGIVSDKTLPELRKLDAGNGEKIPLLSEVFDLVDKKIVVNIELKGEKTAVALHKLIEKYVRYKNWSYENFIISSFDHYQLAEFHSLNKYCKISALICGVPLGYAAFGKKMDAYSVNIAKDFVSKKFVEDAKRRNLKVFAYTVNDFIDYERLNKLKVDGIFTNYPDLFLNL